MIFQTPNYQSTPNDGSLETRLNLVNAHNVVVLVKCFGRSSNFDLFGGGREVIRSLFSRISCFTFAKGLSHRFNLSCGHLFNHDVVVVVDDILAAILGWFASSFAVFCKKWIRNGKIET